MAISYEGFYQGGASSLNPDYGNFTGYRMNASQLGFPGSPQTPNQLGETVNALKQGVKSFEVTMLQGDTGETIPKQGLWSDSMVLPVWLEGHTAILM